MGFNDIARDGGKENTDIMVYTLRFIIKSDGTIDVNHKLIIVSTGFNSNFRKTKLPTYVILILTTFHINEIYLLCFV